MENRGKYKDRIDTELDIYYEVAGGLGSTIVVDEWEKNEKN